jgi:hypothetical protein
LNEDHLVGKTKRTIKQSKPVTVLEAKQTLRLFNEKAALLGRGNFKGKVFIENHGFDMTFGKDRPTEVVKRGADEESTLALVTTLRFFVQARDGISFGQMAELYEILPVSDEDKQDAKQKHEDLEQFLNSPVSNIRLVIHGETQTNRQLFEIFMYGCYAHAYDPAKRLVYETWVRDSPLRATMETLFEEIVADLLNVISSFRPANERAIQRLESLENSMTLPV